SSRRSNLNRPVDDLLRVANEDCHSPTARRFASAERMTFKEVARRRTPGADGAAMSPSCK
ncbi:MAG TPA: hypothetical protein VIJ24_03795, partial [Verrucomicrobiae bacterium]